MPLADTPAMIASGEILGAVTVIGMQHCLLLRAGACYLGREVRDGWQVR